MKILIKGAGDLATGIAYRLYRAGYDVLMTEISIPTTVRRSVAFSRTVYEKEVEVEGVMGVLVSCIDEINKVQESGKIAIMIDEKALICQEYRPDVIVDAIIAKTNLGTTMTDASLVIGIGPGFKAGLDCHAVIETMRGHFLGKVIWKGSAIPNTGIPGEIGGYTTERLLRATADGVFEPAAQIGDQVTKGQVVAYSGGEAVTAQISGIIRGLLQPRVIVTKGMKCGDIDARCQVEHCFTISDKARSIGGGVLEVIAGFEHNKLPY